MHSIKVYFKYISTLSVQKEVYFTYNKNNVSNLLKCEILINNFPELINIRGSHQRCSIKKLFLEISQNSHENTCARVSKPTYNPILSHYPEKRPSTDV